MAAEAGKDPKAMTTGRSATFLESYGWDLLLGSIAAFYVFMVPYTKVEESFNVQAMHDILYHQHHLDKYDHLEFPGAVPRTFIGTFKSTFPKFELVKIDLILSGMVYISSEKPIPALGPFGLWMFSIPGALFISILASPTILFMNFLQLPKIYGLFVVRLVLGCIILFTLRYFRLQVRKKFGYQVEAFFVILTAFQFHTLFYCTRPLPNILAFGLVNLAYGFWLKGSFYATLKCLIFATIIFRCDMLLLLGPIGLGLLLTKSISLVEALKRCIGTALFCVGFTIVVDTIMWKKLVWPEFEVLWFNSVLNRSSEWGTHPFHWYFTSALPRSLLAAYPLLMLGVLLDRRILQYVVPVFFFVLLYSKLPHKELRFIIGSIPVFNLSAAVASSRIYNNRKKGVWKWLYYIIVGSLLASLGCTIVTFMASYENYPGGYALRHLHLTGYDQKKTDDQWVHIDSFSAMNGISRFCENNSEWRYSKEEGIAMEEFRHRNFTYLLNEHSNIDGFKCLSSVSGFSGVRLQIGFPPILLSREPKVFIHGNLKIEGIRHSNWPGCTRGEQKIGG